MATARCPPPADGDDDYAEVPWDFGMCSQYPVLNVGSNGEASAFVQRGDYDLGDDGLIDGYTPWRS